MKERKYDLSFNGKIDAKKAYHKIIKNNTIDERGIMELYMFRKSTVDYINAIRVRYSVYMIVQPYLDAFLSELDRLLVNAVSSLAESQDTLSLIGWR